MPTVKKQPTYNNIQVIKLRKDENGSCDVKLWCFVQCMINKHFVHIKLTYHVRQTDTTTAIHHSMFHEKLQTIGKPDCNSYQDLSFKMMWFFSPTINER